MSTYRERREAKAERLRGWVDKRKREATAALNSNPELRRDWAFITQPGHIPERARMNARDDRAHESLQKAGKMESRAKGIEAQLDRAIYSDDPDAIEALEAKADALERKRTKMKLINAAYRKGDAETFAALGGGILEKERERLNGPGYYSWTRIPYPAYELQNLGATIRTARKRIEEVKARQQVQKETDEAGGVLFTHYGEGLRFVAVQFSEKPERDILTALKAAGFAWSGGRWCGETEKLPPVVVALGAAVDRDLGNAVDYDGEGNPQ